GRRFGKTACFHNRRLSTRIVSRFCAPDSCTRVGRGPSGTTPSSAPQQSVGRGLTERARFLAVALVSCHRATCRCYRLPERGSEKYAGLKVSRPADFDRLPRWNEKAGSDGMR